MTPVAIIHALAEPGARNHGPGRTRTPDPSARRAAAQIDRALFLSYGEDMRPRGRAAKHWPDRAQEARDNAARIDDLQSKRLMLEVAVTYDNLAKKAEERGAK